MESPFTFKRCLLIAGCITLLLWPLVAILSFIDKQQDALWVIILVPPLASFLMVFNFFVLGEIAFRGRRHAIQRHTSLRRQLVRIAVGTLLLYLAGTAYKVVENLPVIGIWFWDFSESIKPLMKLTGFIMFVFGIGELTTHIKKRRQNQQVDPISNSADAV